MIASYQLGESVIVAPYVSGRAKVDALARARALVFPARWDSNSVVMLEAASIGLPIVASSACPFGVELHRVGGALIAELTPDAIANAIVDVTGPQGSVVGAQASDFVSTRCTWPAVAEEFLRQCQPLRL